MMHQNSTIFFISKEEMNINESDFDDAFKSIYITFISSI